MFEQFANQGVLDHSSRDWETNFQGRQCPRVKHSGMYDQCKTDTFNEYFEMFKKMSVEEI